MDKFVLITGGSGFVGRYVIKKFLSENKNIIVITRNKEKYESQGKEIVIEGNLVEQGWWEQLAVYPIETCIHLAWEGIPDYSYEMSIKNLLCGMKVLELCKFNKISNLIISGSCWEYENPIGAVRVSNPLSSENSFKAAKNSLHMLAHAFCKENEINFHWLRLFYVYGNGQRKGSLIPYIVECFKNKQYPELNGAYNRNDFVHATDVADAIYRIAVEKERKYPETLNIGSGYSTRVMDIVYETAKLFGMKFEEERYIQNSKKVDFWANAEEMQRDFGWQSKVSIKEGILKIINDEEWNLL